MSGLRYAVWQFEVRCRAQVNASTAATKAELQVDITEII